ncbi:hypothetical protein, partial [Ralstonia insidiosa]|uniref:hypothetical protein n=1 Tax=Ralstonia insidiosa TaxID=190721 RepID=UPI001ABFA87B
QAIARSADHENLVGELASALKRLADYADWQTKAFTSGRAYLDMTLFPSLCKEAYAALAKAEAQQ